MTPITDVSSFLQWVLTQAHTLAELAPSSQRDLFPEVWGIALEAQGQLQEIDPVLRSRIYAAMHQWLNTGVAAGIVLPDDEHVARYVRELLVYIYNPPPIL